MLYITLKIYKVNTFGLFDKDETRDEPYIKVAHSKKTLNWGSYMYLLRVSFPVATWGKASDGILTRFLSFIFIL